MFNTKLSKLGFILAAGALPAVNAAAGIFVFADDACPADMGSIETHLLMDNAIQMDRRSSISSDFGLEFAYGAAENLELDFSFDFGKHYQSHHYGERQNHFNFTGVSLAAKYQLLSPETEPVGVAIVAGTSYAWAHADHSFAREFAGTLGVNFEMDLLGGDLILVASPGFEIVRAAENSEENDFTEETYSLAFGASYAVFEGLRLGAECFYDYTTRSRDHQDDAFYIGPSAAIEGEDWLFAVAMGVRAFSTEEETGTHDIRLAGQLEYVF